MVYIRPQICPQMFILNKPSSKAPTHIFIKTTLSDGPLKYSTRRKILPSHWIADAQRASVKLQDKNHAQKNKSINAFLERIESIIREYEQSLNYGDTDRSRLIENLDMLTGRKQKNNRKAFFEACTDIVEDMKTGKITIKEGVHEGKRYSPGTIKNYRRKLEALRQFNPRLKFETITMQTYSSLIEWCNGKGYSKNYIGVIVKILKGFLREAHRKGISANLIFQDKDFKILTEVTDDVYFRESELNAMLNLTLPHPYDLVRDWFVLDCYLGLRACDLKILSARNLEKDRITIVNEKTDTKVVVPIHPVVRSILKKHGGFPQRIPEQKINQYIKEVAKKAGLKTRFLYSVTKGGVRVDEYFEKWQMASTHSCRRSFITNLRIAGVDFATRMKLAGIKDPKTLMRYDKLTADENADLAAQHSFFKLKAV